MRDDSKAWRGNYETIQSEEVLCDHDETQHLSGATHAFSPSIRCSPVSAPIRWTLPARPIGWPPSSTSWQWYGGGRRPAHPRHVQTRASHRQHVPGAPYMSCMPCTSHIPPVPCARHAHLHPMHDTPCTSCAMCIMTTDVPTCTHRPTVFLGY